MCGRFVVAGERSDLLGLFEVEFEGEELPPPSWNVRPTDRVPVIVESVKGDEPPIRRLEAARWSLTPSFSPTLKTSVPTFNARSETVAEKAFFKNSVVAKRAIIPADGYFEWLTEGKTKTPYYIYPEAGMLAFAGLYSWWRDPAKAQDDPTRWTLTATILTKDATGPLARVHDRTPVTLPEDWWDHWLDPTIEGDQDFVDEAVRSSVAVSDQLQLHEVAPLTNDNRSEMINPL